MIIDSERITDILGKETMLITTKVEFKVDTDRDEWEKLIHQG